MSGFRFLDLPIELQIMVLEYFRGDRVELNKLCYVSQHISGLAFPILIRDAHLSTAPDKCSHSLLLFLRTILQCPQYAKDVRSLRFAVTKEEIKQDHDSHQDRDAELIIPLRDKSVYELYARKGTRNLALQCFEQGSPLPMILANWKVQLEELRYSSLAGLLLTLLPNLKELDITQWRRPEHYSTSSMRPEDLFWDEELELNDDIYLGQTALNRAIRLQVFPHLEGIQNINKLTTMAENIGILELPFENLKSLVVNLVREEYPDRWLQNELPPFKTWAYQHSVYRPGLFRKYPSISSLSLLSHIEALVTTEVSPYHPITEIPDAIGCNKISELEFILIESRPSLQNIQTTPKPGLSFDSIRTLIEKYKDTLTTLRIDYNVWYGNSMLFTPRLVLRNIEGIGSLKKLTKLKKLAILYPALVGSPNHMTEETPKNSAKALPRSLQELVIIAPQKYIERWLEALYEHRSRYTVLHKLTLECRRFGRKPFEPEALGFTRSYFQNRENGSWRVSILQKFEQAGIEVTVRQGPYDPLWAEDHSEKRRDYRE